MDAMSRVRRLVGEPAIPFATDAGACELIALLAAQQGQGTPHAEIREAFEERERQVCKAVRSGRLVMDYRPPADGTVSLPARDHALYAQGLIYWAATLRRPIARIEEACRRRGDGATREAVTNEVRRIEFENSTMRTDSLHLSSFDDDAAS